MVKLRAIFIIGVVLLMQATTFSQAITGQFIKDNRTGCLVWSDEYSPKDSIAWNGACKNNYADGKGVLLWYQDQQLTANYTGQMKMGKPNGKGKYSYYGLGVMEGNFVEGALHGQGAMYFANGGKTVGHFVKGEFLNLDAPYLSLLKKQYLPIKDDTGIYGNDNGSDKLFYYTLVPKGTIKAVLVLFPSTGETVENVISCNKILLQQAYNKGILSAVVSANYNKSLEKDTLAVHFFETVFKDLVTKYKAPKDKFILCGLSLGGENALQYTQLSRNAQYTTYLKPLAVIGVDPPVDNVTLYHHAKEEIDLYTKDTARITPSKRLALNEDRFLIQYYHDLYGGPPEAFSDKYIAGSVFSLNQADGGNAKYLIDVPVRIYSDPDVVWQLAHKGRDFYHMNAPDQSAMIRFLLSKGNKRAAFVQALGKGYRVDGTRHPHSWSIVEPKECVEWVMGLVK